MTTDEIHAEIDQIERSAMLDQPGWKEYLDRLSDRGRERHLEILFKDQPQHFDRWRLLKLTIADPYSA